MELIVIRGDVEERVRVERRGEVFEVEVGERRYRIDSVAVDGSLRSLLIAGRQYEVSIRERGEGRYRVTRQGGVEEILVQDPLTHLAELSRAAGGERGPHRISAYMPGRVVSVMVAEGDEVAAGQGLLVLEAMKMENEIEAEHAGVVRRVLVSPGQAVEGGDPLLEIE